MPITKSSFVFVTNLSLRIQRDVVSVQYHVRLKLFMTRFAVNGFLQHVIAIPLLAAVAVQIVQAAVNLYNIRAARPFMQAVNVHGDYRYIIPAIAKCAGFGFAWSQVLLI